ncbi:hypothetical protein [Kitasatospora sp. MMS16-BH015]|nr:hypothetical protein [Kitasatospora sp. MMS16-BH015]
MSTVAVRNTRRVSVEATAVNDLSGVLDDAVIPTPTPTPTPTRSQ